MLGMWELPLTIGTVIFVTVLIITLSFVSAELINVRALIATSNEIIREIDIAHIAKKCFGKDGFILEGFLEENNGKPLKELCSINTDASVTVSDLDAGKTWSFARRSDVGTKIFVSIVSEDGIHIGELNADA